MITQIAIKATNLSKAYYGKVIFKDLNFEIISGTINCLMGPNGAGKTTLIKLISTLAIPSAGEVEIFGIKISAEAENARNFLSVVLHPSLLYPELTVKDNLKFVANCYGIPKEKIDTILQDLNLIAFQNYKVKNLSQGTRKRASLAKALITSPKILILDEPFANLDSASVEILKNILKSEKEKGTTIILTTHIYEQIQDLINTTWLLENGNLQVK